MHALECDKAEALFEEVQLVSSKIKQQAIQDECDITPGRIPWTKRAQKANFRMKAVRNEVSSFLLSIFMMVRYHRLRVYNKLPRMVGK